MYIATPELEARDDMTEYTLPTQDVTVTAVSQPETPKTEESAQPEATGDDIKAMARAVLTKRSGKV